MEWHDDAVILGVRRQGEGHVVLEVLTRDHGRHLGLVRGGRSARMQPLLQPGNSVTVDWRARLEDHLGAFRIEATRLRAGRLMQSPAALYGIGLVGALARLLPERDPHPALYETLEVVADALDDPALAAPLVVRFELAILAELGFGLSLDACAATGGNDGLAYVSPRTGRAVSASAGAPWSDRLLPLPAFLAGGTGMPLQGLPGSEELAQAFRLTGHFLMRHVFEPRGIAVPEVRAAFIAAVTA
jgi:DNA repair protein RecO (recombination protein O)